MSICRRDPGLLFSSSCSLRAGCSGCGVHWPFQLIHNRDEFFLDVVLGWWVNISTRLSWNGVAPSLVQYSIVMKLIMREPAMSSAVISLVTK
jgi:hypothetical protein